MKVRGYLLVFLMSCLVIWGCGGKDVRFVAYTPTLYDPTTEPMVKPTKESISEDLRTIKPHFDGIITYGVAHDPEGLIPELVQSEGFRTMILGVWDIQSEIEIAIQQAKDHPKLIAAICVGNEGLTFNRYDWNELEAAMERVRQSVPHVAVTTTEPIHQYENPRLVEISDIVLPNIHAWWADNIPKNDPVRCAKWTVEQVDKLRKRSDKEIIVKESGLPSGGHQECSEERQAVFWRTLFELAKAQKRCNYAIFEAFDVPWKAKEIGSDYESYWGFWTKDRKPKPVVNELKK